MTSVLYDLIENKPDALSASEACRVVGVSRRWYAQWINEPPVTEDDGLLREIQDAAKMPRYGYRRVTAELKRKSIHVNHKKVLRVMRENGLLCKRKAFKPRTTNSKHGFQRYPNLVKDVQETGLNHVWTADITFVQLPNGFAYLASILDRFSRKCIGWSLGRSLEASLAVNALLGAFDCRKGVDLSDCIHHSDQGVQYACLEYVALLEKRGMRVSMSEKGNPYENAFAESFFKTLKVEEVYLSEYLDFDDALANIESFIEEVYNKKRLHSSIGYVPPDEFEAQILKEARS